MKDIVITSNLPQSVIEALESNYRVRQLNLKETGPDAFLKALGNAEGLVVSPGDPVNRELIQRLPDTIKVIASYSVGLDHVDTEAAAERSLPVTNTPDVLTDATADIALLLILGALRGVASATQMLRDRQWQGWEPAQIFGRDLAGKTLAIFGAGRIGVATAKRAQAFGMNVIYWSGRHHSAAMDQLGATAVDNLDAFLAQAQVLSLHAPSTPQTRGLVNTALIEKLPAGAVLINTARGDLVVDDDVINALRQGRLSAIGFDVFTNEPAIDTRYYNLKNAFLLPHIGSSTEETRATMGRLVLQGLDRHLSDPC